MEPNEKWSDEVKAIFMAMQADVMSSFMTPVGWAQLYLKCSAWDREFKPKFLGISAEGDVKMGKAPRSEEHTSELQSRFDLVCRLLLEKKKEDRRSAPRIKEL